MEIRYQIEDTHPDARLRGLVVEGELETRDGVDLLVVGLVTLPGGTRANLSLRVYGRPELEAAWAAMVETNRIRDGVLTRIGWTAYSAAQENLINAREAYSRASEHGYPAREARELKEAADVCEIARGGYPLAAAYGVAVAWCEASNDRKCAAGRRARQAIEAGENIPAAISAMRDEWSRAAAEAVARA